MTPRPLTSGRGRARLLLAVLGAAVGGGVAGALAAQELLPLERPAAGAVEPSVHRELGAVHDLVEELAGSAAPAARRATAYGDLGELYLAYELWDAAQACLHNARTLAPRTSRWSYLLGYVEQQRSRLEAAAAHFESVLELEPAHLAARLRLGEVRLDLGEAAAEAEFRRALSRDPASAAAHFGLARALLLNGDAAAAVVHFERALELAPGATRVHYPLALALRAAGRGEAARRHLDLRGEGDVAIPDPVLAQVRRRAQGGAFLKFRGDQAVLAGELEAAVEAYRQAVAAAPGDYYARKSLGLTLHRLGDRRGAARELGAALELDPGGEAAAEKADLRFTLGSMALNQGRLGVAEGHYAAALALDPDHADSLFQMGNLRGREGRLEEAAALFERALETAPERVDLRLQRATTLMDLGRFAEAAGELRRLLELDPDHPAAPRLLAIAVERSSRD